MVEVVAPQHTSSLADYESDAALSATVRELRQTAESCSTAMRGRRVVMVNSTAQGGGVAELLPPMLGLMGDLGVESKWLVMEADDPAFFPLTKRLHNLIHGLGPSHLGRADRELYDAVSAANANAIAPFLNPGDILVAHDPQPMGAGVLLREQMDIAAIWRCHIGLDRQTPQTRAAWGFLESFAAPYDHAVFTTPEYIPACFTGRATIIHPGIDPLSNKNRPLRVHEVVGILANAGLAEPRGPIATPDFEEPAKRLQPGGGWVRATKPDDFGLLFRPIVTQISRWDRLKGFLPLMKGFAALKQRLETRVGLGTQHKQILRLVRLVIAGPNPASVDDDPEGKEVLAELCGAYEALSPSLQADIAMISLPMSSTTNNALIVNALQRCSDIVVQNSIQEGFGLTVTEPMWKRAGIIGSAAAGIRQQIRPGLDGVLVDDPENTEEIADALDALLSHPARREAYGRNARQRVHDHFLVFNQVSAWLELLTNTIAARWPSH